MSCNPVPSLSREAGSRPGPLQWSESQGLVPWVHCAYCQLHSWQCSPAHNQHKGQTPKRFQGKRKKKEVQSIILAISSKTHHLQSSSAFARHQEDKTLK